MKRIEEVYAVLSYDPLLHSEGIVASYQFGIGWQPLVFSEVHKVHELSSALRKIATESNRTLKIVRFTGRLEIEEVKP